MSLAIVEINRILASLAERGISEKYIERVLELPSGSVGKWKFGSISNEETQLLKIIAVYPWILEVADNHFDEKFAAAKVVEEAANITCSKLLEN